MSRKLFVRIIAIVMALLMALSVLYVVVSSFSARAVVTQSDIDKLKKKQNEIEKQKQEIRSQINSLEYEQSTALAKKQVLDDQINLTQQDIDNITELIAKYEELIAIKNQEVIDAQQNENNQLALFKARMRTMEENGAISYISVIFNANSFSDLLARIDAVTEIMQYDENLYKQLRAAKETTIEAQASLVEAKAGLDVEKADLDVKKAELLTQQEEADKLLDQISQDIKAAEELYQQELDAGKQIQSEINKKVEELKKLQQVKGTGRLIWPLPSSNVVTSPFGQRTHPIYKELMMHNGIDISAKYGASVLAADSGVVVISEYSASYGNYVVISHGNGVVTLYAHLSQRLVKENDKITQAQVIGKAGSTGNSTGPHLHYEVSVDGERRNPLNYYDSSTYVKKGW